MAHKFKIQAHFVKYYHRTIELCSTFIKNIYDKTKQVDVKGGRHNYSKPTKEPLIPARLLFYLISAFFCFFVIWASFFQIEEFVHAHGQVQPASEVKVLSHFEGGVVTDILVKEGDWVEKDQVLVKLKDTAAQASLDESEQNIAVNSINITRLHAQLDEKPLVFPENFVKEKPELIKEAEQQYKLRVESLKNKQAIFQDQLTQKRVNWQNP